jgi:hypothetical protein
VPDDALAETLEILADDDLMESRRASRAEAAAGDLVDLEDLLGDRPTP